MPRDVEYGMLSYRPLINHRRKRFAISDGIVCRLVAFKNLYYCMLAALDDVGAKPH